MDSVPTANTPTETTPTSPYGDLQGPRPARSEEQTALITVLDTIFRTSRGWEPSIGKDWVHVYAPENLENVHVFTDRGQIVASTGLWVNEVALGDVRLRVGGISCVGTLEDYRRAGLGMQLMQAARRRMETLGCHVGLLFTGISNWYRKLGWERAGTVRTYPIDRGNVALLPQLPADIQTRFATDDDDDAIVALRNAEAFGAIRNVTSFRTLKVARQIAATFLAERDGAALAYVMVHRGNIAEWAGPAEIVAGLARALYTTWDDPDAATSARAADHGPASMQYLTLTTPGGAHPLPALLDALGIPAQTGYQGMMTVVDPAAILDAYGISGIRVTPSDDEFVLHAGDRSHRLSREQLTKCFFGPERVVAPEIPGLPVPFWQWYLEYV